MSRRGYVIAGCLLTFIVGATYLLSKNAPQTQARGTVDTLAIPPDVEAHTAYLLCIDMLLTDRVVFGDLPKNESLDGAFEACLVQEERYLTYFLADFENKAGRELSEADKMKARVFFRGRVRRDFEEAIRNYQLRFGE